MASTTAARAHTSTRLRRLGKRRKTISDELRDEVLKAHKELGLTAAEIANLTGLHRVSVHRLLRDGQPS